MAAEVVAVVEALSVAFLELPTAAEDDVLLAVVVALEDAELVALVLTVVLLLLLVVAASEDLDRDRLCERWCGIR